MPSLVRLKLRTQLEVKSLMIASLFFLFIHDETGHTIQL